MLKIFILNEISKVVNNGFGNDDLSITGGVQVDSVPDQMGDFSAALVNKKDNSLGEGCGLYCMINSF